MSLRIVFSGDTQVLASRLADDLRSDPGQASILETTRILCPNRNLELWLRKRLAELAGVSVNLEFPYLERGLWELVGIVGVARGVVTPDAAGRPAVRESDAVVTRSRVAAVLMKQALAGDAGSPIVSYCLSGGGLSDQGFAVRLWQVAGRLADLFREYEFSRTTMVREWLAGRDLPGASDVALEQARIYRMVCGSDLSGEPCGGQPGMSLFELAETVFPQRPSAASNPTPTPLRIGPVYIFGMSSMSPYHCRIIYELCRFLDIRMYHLNACREFWEDASTPREDRWRRIRKATCDETGELVLGDALDDNPLLKAWGKAGRETVKLLADLDDQSGLVEVVWADEDDVALNVPTTVLDSVRRGIRHRTSSVAAASMDESLTVSSCPGPEREVEWVHEQIFELLERDPSLRLSDIAVLVADIDTYKPLIQTVFERDSDSLPYRLADSTASMDSLWAAGVKGLIDLVGSDFSRRQVLELLVNPCFMASCGVPAGDVDKWTEWVVRLGVFHDMYDPPGVDPEIPGVFTWSRALERIRMGRVMKPFAEPSVRDFVAEGEARPMKPCPASDGAFADLWPYVDMDTAGGTADLFVVTIERLWAAVSSLNGHWASPGRWGRLLLDLFDDFLAIPSDREGEWTVRRAVIDGMSPVLSDESELSRSLAANGLDVEIPAHLAFEVVKGILSGVSVGRRAGFGEGITVASMKPMRPIPFRVVFVLGLQEGGFPGNRRESSLDLRSGARVIGDITTPDAGRYMFLETVLCTTDSLRLSFDGWDTVRDRRNEPCSVVRQLESFVTSSVLPASTDGTAASFARVEVPLSPFSRRYLVPPWSGRRRRMRDRVLSAFVEAGRGGRGDELQKALVEAIRVGDGGDVKDYAGLADLRSALALFDRSASDSLRPPPSSAGARARTRIRSLAVFLENPCRARLERAFGITGFDDDGTDVFVSDEPFEADRMALSRLKKQFRHDLVASGGRPEVASELLRVRGAINHAKGQAPSGLFRLPAEDALIEDLDVLNDESIEQIAAGGWLEHGVLGDEMPDGFRPGLVAPAVRLTVSPAKSGSAPVEVELSGSIEFVSPPTDGRCVGFGVSISSRIEDPAFHVKLFDPFLFGLAWGTGEGIDPIRFRVAVFGTGKCIERVIEVSSERAMEILSGVVDDYLDDERLLECLPFKLVDQMMKSVESDDFDEEKAANRIRAGIEEGFTGASRQYFPGRAESLMKDRLQVPVDLRGVLKRRYGGILELFGLVDHSGAEGGDAGD